MRDFPNANGTYLTAGDAAPVDITGTLLSVSAWVKHQVAAPAATVVIAGKEDAGATGQYALAFQSGTGVSVWRCSAPGTFDQVLGTAAPAGTMRHLLGVKESQAVQKIYEGGVLAGATSADTAIIPNTANAFLIGNRVANNAFCYGAIGEVAVWLAALNAEEAVALARGTSPRLIRPTALKAWWPIYGDGSGEADLSGLGSNTTIVGTPTKALNHCPVGMPYLSVGG